MVAAPRTAEFVSAAGATSAYVAMPVSQRLVDSRPTGPLGAGGTLSVSVTGAAPLPAPGTVTAAVLNLTVVAPFGPGFWTAWPHTSARPEASNLNIDELQSLAGGAVPNLVTVPVGADGVVDVYASAGGNVIVDLLGYYTAADSSTSGRFQALTAPTRVLDTRRVATFAPGETRAFTFPGAAGANAVAVNLTSVTNVPGYWKLYPQGGVAPATSNLNSPPGLSAVVANQAIVTVDPSGTVNIFSEQGGDLLIDLVGTYTGAGAPSSSVGLFVPMTAPTRIVDTRVPALNPLGATNRPAPSSTFEVPLAGNPADRTARRCGSGAQCHECWHPDNRVRDGEHGGCRCSWPAAADVDHERHAPAQVLANHAIVPVSARGFSMFTQAGGDMLADLAGYFIGSPAPAPFGGPVNAPPPGCATPAVGYAGAPVGPIVWGSSRAAVATLQGRLLQLGFWNAGMDGGYGLTTVQAVMAFQKWRGLPATTVVDTATAVALNLQFCRPAAGTTTGTLLEIDKTKQIAYVIQNGQMTHIFNVSTGNGKTYDEEDQKNAGRRSIGIA